MISSRPIAAAQPIPLRGDVAANLAEHVRLIGLAAAQDAELSLTGYELDLASALAFSEQDARLDSLREQALAQRMTLIVGAPVRLADRIAEPTATWPACSSFQPILPRIALGAQATRGSTP